MPTRSRVGFVAMLHLVAILAGAFFAPVAQADTLKARVEAEARGLQKRAMSEDYLATDFTKANEALDRAIRICGNNRCSSQLRAELRRDRATVLVATKGDRNRALELLAEALRINPAVLLDPDFKSAELETLYHKAKGDVAATAGDLPQDRAGDPSRVGDFIHVAPTEQVVRTPIPIAVEYAGTGKLSRVVVRYKGSGMQDWGSLDLTHYAKAYGGSVPCEDVLPGDFAYFIEGLTQDGNLVGAAGDKRSPFLVSVRATIDGPAPHLPGRPPPKQCSEAMAVCEAGTSGCNADGTIAKKISGEQCVADTECLSLICSAGTCVPKPRSFVRYWVGLSGSIDMTFVPSGTDVCKLNVSTSEPGGSASYYCVDAANQDYPTRLNQSGNNSILPSVNGDDSVAGGAALGNVRALASFDYAINANLLVGARAGYVLNTYPGQAANTDGKTFIPIHLEARATFVLGREGIAKPGLEQMLFVGFGVSQYDAAVSVDLLENSSAGPPSTRAVNAWAIGGPTFIVAGVGVRYSLAPRAAILLAPKFSIAFGGAAVLPVIAPEVGFQVGF